MENLSTRNERGPNPPSFEQFRLKNFERVIDLNRVDRGEEDQICKKLQDIVSSRIELKMSNIKDNRQFFERICAALAENKNCQKVALTLHKCGLQESDVAQLVKLKEKLTELDVSQNDLDSASTKHIGELTLLDKLNISKNQLNAGSAKDIAKLKLLTILKIHENNLGDDGASEISTLPLLKDLNISNNQMFKPYPRQLSIETVHDRAQFYAMDIEI